MSLPFGRVTLCPRVQPQLLCVIHRASVIRPGCLPRPLLLHAAAALNCSLLLNMKSFHHLWLWTSCSHFLACPAFPSTEPLFILQGSSEVPTSLLWSLPISPPFSGYLSSALTKQLTTFPCDHRSTAFPLPSVLHGRWWFGFFFWWFLLNFNSLLIYFLSFLFYIGVALINNAVILQVDSKGLSHSHTFIPSPPNAPPSQAV